MNEETEKAIIHSFVHFFHMDMANAAIHCAKVRFSPITFRLAEAIQREQISISGHAYNSLTIVSDHAGKYEEDKGR